MVGTEIINQYITKRYDRWMDYARYYSSQAGIEDQAADVLNEVMCSLLKKDINKLLSLFNKKSGQYTELDYFVLKMIRINAISQTSPYRRKYATLPKDANIDFANIELADTEYDDVDRPDEILLMMNRLREVIDELGLSDKHKRIFYFKFFEGESFRSWSGKETLSELYKEYNSILNLIKKHVNGETLL